ncbi:MAG TPA: phosphatase PAP2 family protein [Noviherbaspirillum sp.]
MSLDTRVLAWRWGALLLSVAGLVAISKLVFMAWGWGIRRLDFIGLSGHSAMAALVWPSLLGLVWGNRPLAWRWAATGGLLLALLIALSRVTLHAHSIAEVATGFLAGAAAALLFLLRWGERRRLFRHGWLLAVSVVLALPFVYGHRFPSERMLRSVAQALSRDNVVHTRHDFREHDGRVDAGMTGAHQ